MLTKDEVNYLAKIDPIQKTTVFSFDPKAKSTGDMLVKKIKNRLPKVEILFMGATALEIAGQNDIDIYVLSKPNNFDKYLPDLKSLFGKPKNTHNTFIEWSFYQDGYPVELYLTEPPDRQIKVYKILKANPKLLKEYEQLKLKYNDKSFQDYQKAKYEFYNKILINE